MLGLQVYMVLRIELGGFVFARQALCQLSYIPNPTIHDAFILSVDY